MQQLFFGACVCAVVAGGVYLSTDGASGKAYAMTVEEATSKLIYAPKNHGKAEFNRSNGSVKKPTPNTLQWKVSSLQNAVTCTAKLNKVGEGQVSVTKSCIGGGPDGSEAASFASGSMEISFNEFVDSTLENRPYNSDLVKNTKVSYAANNVSSIFSEVGSELDRIDAERFVNNRGASSDESHKQLLKSLAEQRAADAETKKPKYEFGDPTSPIE